MRKILFVETTLACSMLWIHITIKIQKIHIRHFVVFKIRYLQGGFLTGLPLKVLSTKKLILARLSESRTIYVNVDTPNLGFTYFNFLGGFQLKTPCMKLPKRKEPNKLEFSV